MRWETAEQILKVVAIAGKRFKQGYGIDQSYQHGVKRVSQEYGVAYQTIGDACRRRLGLDNIGKFKAMLEATFEENPDDLRTLILSETSSSYHGRIEKFFSNLKNGVNNTEEKPLDTLISYTVQLRKVDSDILKALAQLLGDRPEEILSGIVVEAIKERMRHAVRQL